MVADIRGTLGENFTLSALLPFLLFVFQGVFPCMEYSIESVTLATAAFFVWTINCNLTLTLTLTLWCHIIAVRQTAIAHHGSNS